MSCSCIDAEGPRADGACFLDAPGPSCRAARNVKGEIEDFVEQWSPLLMQNDLASRSFTRSARLAGSRTAVRANALANTRFHA